MSRLAILSAFALALLAQTGTPAQAREYPWCVRYDWSTYNCGFVSFAQCMATASGQNAARCEQNPRYVGEAPRKRKPVR
jgi:hypothetical protein